jgi:hypothetical protein
MVRIGQDRTIGSEVVTKNAKAIVAAVNNDGFRIVGVTCFSGPGEPDIDLVVFSQGQQFIGPRVEGDIEQGSPLGRLHLVYAKEVPVWKRFPKGPRRDRPKG